MSATISNKGRIAKRSSNSYSGDEWKRHRPLITQLYSEEGRTLKEVREHLENEYGFAPTERMYKSRLHTWGLDKKKKEHEMLDLVRQGLSQKGMDRDKVFLVRGKQVTLADALHYFNRKGIKDPASLLENSPDLPRDHSSPEEYDIQTPLSSRGDVFDAQNAISDSDYDMSVQSPDLATISGNAERTEYLKAADLAGGRLRQVCDRLGYANLEPLPPFRTVVVEAYIQGDKPSDPDSARYFEAIYAQTQSHYREIFNKRDINLTNIGGPWTSTSDESLSDQFYYLMYHGYSYLWNDQRRTAFENFEKAFGMIEQLIKESHVGFLIYIFDLVIRHDGTGYEEPLLLLLQQLTQLSEVVFRNTSNHIYLIASWLLNAPPDVSRAWIALSTLRKLLDFFQDSIGYFHPETVALLQTFATGLLNKKHYLESAARFQQLVDAVSTTKSKTCYEYKESLQAIHMALECSRGIPWLEEREIHVRCLRALAEISNATGQRDEAMISIGNVVEICAAVFGPDHTFTKRARMHQKSLRKGEALKDGALPPMVYRLGRGGSAAKYVWTTRSSPTRLQA